MSGIDPKKVAVWLFLCCGMIIVLMVVGGWGRLTGGGVGLASWGGDRDWLPPLDAAAWQALLEQYRHSLVFQRVSGPTDMADFQAAFWLAYGHRFLGQLTGLFFLGPFLYLLVTRRLGRNLTVKLLLIFFLGGLQALMGWYSGLADAPGTGSHWSTAHLGLALLVYATLFWVALGLWFGQRSRPPAALARLGLLAVGVTVVILLAIFSGGFMAGLEAGLAFNTFPRMGGRWFPDNYLLLQPAFLNFFENIATVQWDHRLLAGLVFVLVGILWWFTLRHPLPVRLRLAIHLLLGLVVLQFALGVATLLWYVPLPLALAHQVGAVLLLSSALAVTQWLRHGNLETGGAAQGGEGP